MFKSIHFIQWIFEASLGYLRIDESHYSLNLVPNGAPASVSAGIAVLSDHTRLHFLFIFISR